MQKQQNSTIVIIFSHLAIIFTVMSQMLEIQNILRPLMFACWGVTLIYSLFAKRALYINSYIKTFGLAMVFILFHNIFCFFIYKEVEISNYFTVALIPLFIFFTMFQIAGYIDINNFNNMLKSYCICAVVFAVYLNIWYIPSLDTWLSTQLYIYDSKNSAAQIFMSAVIIMLFYLKSKTFFVNILKIAAVCYLLSISVFLQCRTAILGFCCVIAFHFIMRSSVKIRAVFITLMVLVVLIVITNEKLFEIFEHTFGFDKYEDATVNDLSSGRLDLYKIAFENFMKNPLVGRVSYYVDCMYISVYTALGVFGGTAVLIPWFKRISKNFKSLKFAMEHKTNSNLEITVCYLTIFYLVESLLEGLPPFGPGACSVMFWLLCSYMDYTYYKPTKGSFLPMEEGLST